MAPVVLSWEVTGCRRKIEAVRVIEIFKIHDQQVYVVTNKLEKPSQVPRTEDVWRRCRVLSP